MNTKMRNSFVMAALSLLLAVGGALAVLAMQGNDNSSRECPCKGVPANCICKGDKPCCKDGKACCKDGKACCKSKACCIDAKSCCKDGKACCKDEKACEKDSTGVHGHGHHHHGHGHGHHHGHGYGDKAGCCKEMKAL